MSGADQVSVVDLFRDPTKVEGLSCGQIPALLTQLSTLQTAMALRLVTGEQQSPTADELLGISQAAKRLGTSTDWLYRRTKSLPFVVRVGRHVRFSAHGIDRYVKRQTGR